MNRSILAMVLSVCVAVTLAACSTQPGPTNPASPTNSASPAPQSRTVAACDNREVVFEKVPDRIVAMDASSAAFLIELGVGEKIVGLSGTNYIADYDGELRQKLDAIKVLSDGPATQEIVLAADPDLVVAVTDFAFGKFKGTASLETLTQNGIKALWACETVSAAETTTLESTDDYIKQLATALDRQDAGTKLVSSLAAEVKQATTNVQGKAVPTLLYTGLAKGGGGVFTRGGKTYVNGMLTVSGASNIAAGLDGNIVEISVEKIVAEDPKIIVAAIGMGGGMGPKNEAEVKEAIQADPRLSATTAAKTGRIVVVPSRLLLGPSLLNPKAIATIATAVAAAE